MKSNLNRPRRNRATDSIRQLVQETHLLPCDFVQPLFVQEGENLATPIESLPGCYRLSLDKLLDEVQSCQDAGILAIALFPVIPGAKKDAMAKESANEKGLLPNTIRAIKERFPEMCVISDVAMDPYSSDGHDGIVKNGKILNDETLEVLAKMACVQAKAGADIVAPSDMMDGRVQKIREALDKNGFQETGILSYAAKYASAFYGPFRDALDSAPKAGDKKTYQMDPANSREALREIELDIAEGADILMVKPAIHYLDVIRLARDTTNLPVAAYHVSGEYAMIKAASEKGWLNEKTAFSEALLSIKRAGANIIFTYYAKEMALQLSNS